MDRAEFERLDRDALIARAESAGVSRASILTRPELVDELLVRSAKGDDPKLQRARGFFGRARDLLARIIERGLHLPDAAERIRSRGSVPPPPPRTTPSVVPTFTLAEIYAAQGHREKAIDTLKHVIERESDHDAARALLAQLEDKSYPVPKPALPPEEEDGRKAKVPPQRAEPLGFLDDEPLPPKYDVDECVAIPVDPTTLFVYWEVRDATRAFLESTRPGGVIALRVLVIVPTWDGPRSHERDADVGASLGDHFVRDLPAGCVVRAAIGWRVGDVFLPLSHSPALETPPSEPFPVVADLLVRWTPRGATPIGPLDADASSIERALGRARTHGAVGRAGRALGSSPAGSSHARVP